MPAVTLVFELAVLAPILLVPSRGQLSNFADMAEKYRSYKRGFPENVNKDTFLRSEITLQYDSMDYVPMRNVSILFSLFSLFYYKFYFKCKQL